jgi:hypothetical protein
MRAKDKLYCEYGVDDTDIVRAMKTHNLGESDELKLMLEQIKIEAQERLKAVGVRI